MQNILFSIVMPAYNRADVLPEAVDSVLHQSFHSWELVIVDDGSNDNTKDVILPFLSDKRISYCYKSNGGVCSARNFGAEKAVGQYLVFLDSDDIVKPDWLEKIEQIIDDNVGMAFCGLKYQYSKNNKQFKKPSDLGYLYNNLTGLFLAGTFFIQRKLFFEAGKYDENIVYGENYELGMRLSQVAQNCKCINDPLIIYRNITKFDRDYITQRAASREYLIQKYHENAILARHDLRRFKFDTLQLLAIDYYHLGQKTCGIKKLFSAIKFYPLNYRSYYRMILGIFNYYRKC